MEIKKSMPNSRYAKIDNKLWADNTLSDGAKVMYGFIASLPNGKTITDRYISRALDVSLRTVTNRKNELKEAKLLLMVQLAPRIYELYVGHYNFTASSVRDVWEQDNE